jgi:hypothetical protein
LITPHLQTPHARRVGAGVASTSSRPEVPPLGQMALTIQAAKKRAFAIIGNLRRRQIRVHVSLGVVMGGHFVSFATLLVQPKPPAFPFLKVVLHVHADHRAHPGERVNHHPDHGAIAQSGNRAEIDVVQ